LQNRARGACREFQGRGGPERRGAGNWKEWARAWRRDVKKHQVAPDIKSKETPWIVLRKDGEKMRKKK